MNYFWAFWWVFSLIAMALILKGVRVGMDYSLNLLDPWTRTLACLPFAAMGIWWIGKFLVLPLIHKWQRSKSAARDNLSIRDFTGDR